ncbi:MAG: hypothetical protein OXC07_13420 [Kistimonas sp.]|nr:hypothetical protein [Kistimonas sp.]
MHNQKVTVQGPPSPMTGVTQGSIGPVGEQDATFVGRSVHRACGSDSFEMSGAGFPVSNARPAEAARILAETMNTAIGTDEIFSGKEAIMLEGLGFSWEEIAMLMEKYPHQPCRVRGAMEDFVRREMRQVVDDQAIMKKFIRACQDAEICWQEVARIESCFVQIRQGADLTDRSSDMEVQDTRGESVRLTADQERIRELEALLRTSGDCVHSFEAKWREASHDARQLLEQVTRLQQEKEEDARTIQSLSQAKSRLQRDLQLLQEELRQARADQVVLDEAQARAEAVSLDDYGENAEVNELIRQFTTMEIGQNGKIRRTLCYETCEHQKLWEIFWKNMELIRDSGIARVKGEIRNHPGEQVREMFRYVVSHNKRNMHFLELFESKHMPVRLRRALYDVMVRNIEHLKKEYAAARKFPVQ